MVAKLLIPRHSFPQHSKALPNEKIFITTYICYTHPQYGFPPKGTFRILCGKLPWVNGPHILPERRKYALTQKPRNVRLFPKTQEPLTNAERGVSDPSLWALSCQLPGQEPGQGPKMQLHIMRRRGLYLSSLPRGNPAATWGTG